MELKYGEWNTEFVSARPQNSPENGKYLSGMNCLQRGMKLFAMVENSFCSVWRYNSEEKIELSVQVLISS